MPVGPGLCGLGTPGSLGSAGVRGVGALPPGTLGDGVAGAAGLWALGRGLR